MMPASSPAYLPSTTDRAARASRASVLCHNSAKSASARSLACRQNRSASSVPAGSFSDLARTHAADIANNSAPMSTSRARKPC